MCTIVRHLYYCGNFWIQIIQIGVLIYNVACCLVSLHAAYNLNSWLLIPMIALDLRSDGSRIIVDTKNVYFCFYWHTSFFYRIRVLLLNKDILLVTKRSHIMGSSSFENNDVTVLLPPEFFHQNSLRLMNNNSYRRGTGKTKTLLLLIINIISDAILLLLRPAVTTVAVLLMANIRQQQCHPVILRIGADVRRW